MGIDPVTHKPKNDALFSTDGQSKNAANLSHMAQWESARLEAEARLVRQSKLRSNSASSPSFQAPSPDFASTSSQLQKPAGGAARPCIDVLKAWNGGWSGKTSETAAAAVSGLGGELESPTSTLSSAAGVGESSTAFVEFAGISSGSCDGGLMKEEGEASLFPVTSPPPLFFPQSAGTGGGKRERERGRWRGEGGREGEKRGMGLGRRERGGGEGSREGRGRSGLGLGLGGMEGGG